MATYFNIIYLILTPYAYAGFIIFDFIYCFYLKTLKGSYDEDYLQPSPSEFSLDLLLLFSLLLKCLRAT